MTTDPLRNTKDPLRKSGPEAEQELFRALGRACNDFPRDVVLGAAMNLIVNAIRQEHAGRNAACNAFDEVMARTKAVLLDKHYDEMGKRRNVFPFHQVIEPMLFVNKSRAH
jgi:acyl carrier protein phosphodiesterase